MPEGDTLHKLAAKIRPGMIERPIVELRERDRGPIAALQGKTITEVTAIGKNLLIAVEPRWMIRVHLGLRGRGIMWPLSVDWPRKSYAATLVLATDRIAFGTFRTMHARAHRRDDPQLERVLANLGPDLLADDVDLPIVISRARGPAHAGAPIGEVLLDQRIAAGIGNVYRCELLFLEGVHPWTPVSTLDDATLSALFARARTLMQENLVAGARSTVGRAAGLAANPAPRSCSCTAAGACRASAAVRRSSARCSATKRARSTGAHAASPNPEPPGLRRSIVDSMRSVACLLVAPLMACGADAPTDESDASTGDSPIVCEDVTLTPIPTSDIGRYAPDYMEFLDAYLGEHPVALWLDDDEEAYGSPPSGAVEGVLRVEQVGSKYQLRESSTCTSTILATFAFTLTVASPDGLLILLTVNEFLQTPSLQSGGRTSKAPDATVEQIEGAFGDAKAFPESSTPEVRLELVRSTPGNQPEPWCTGHIVARAPLDETAPTPYAELTCL